MITTKEIHETVFREVLKRLQAIEAEPYVPIGVSNRHVHLCREDLETLFGKGYQLTELKKLKQPGQFAANETVNLIGRKGQINNVRILGPLRSRTQVEVSVTDGFRLGVQAPIKESGKTEGTPGIVLEGPKGMKEISSGLIIAHRHIHMPTEFAEKFNLQDKEMVDVELGKERKTIFANVLIRVSDEYALEMHIDTDEANAACVQNGDYGKIQKGLGNVCP